jgi:hypothetical protein
MTTCLTKKALPSFAFWDFCVRALPSSLSLEMSKPKMGLTSSLDPLSPNPCDHLSEKTLTPNGAIGIRLLRFMLQGILVPSISKTRKPGIIRIYDPDIRLDQWPGLNPDIPPFDILAGSSLLFPQSPEPRWLWIFSMRPLQMDGPDSFVPQNVDSRVYTLD